MASIEISPLSAASAGPGLRLHATAEHS